MQQLIKYRSSRINTIMWKQVGTKDTRANFLQFDMHILQKYKNIILNHNCFEYIKDEII